MALRFMRARMFVRNRLQQQQERSSAVSTWIHRCSSLPSSSFSSSSSAIIGSSDFKKHSSAFTDPAAAECRSSTPPADPDALLLKLLKRDLKTASKTMQRYHVDIEGAFEPFEFVSEEGCSNAVLSRRIGNEEITIKCVLEVEEPDELEALLEESENGTETVHILNLTIRISKVLEAKDGAKPSGKDKPYVQLVGYFIDKKIRLEEVAFVDKSNIGESFPYYGPAFHHLNQNTQKAFHDILKARGFDARLANRVMDHLSSKYQSEYLLWVRKLHSFMKR